MKRLDAFPLGSPTEAEIARHASERLGDPDVERFVDGWLAPRRYGGTPTLSDAEAAEIAEKIERRAPAAPVAKPEVEAETRREPPPATPADRDDAAELQGPAGDGAERRPAPRPAPTETSRPAPPPRDVGPRIRPFRQRLFASFVTGLQGVLGVILWFAGFMAVFYVGYAIYRGLLPRYPRLPEWLQWWPVTLTLLAIGGFLMEQLFGFAFHSSTWLLRITPLGRGLDLHEQIRREAKVHAATGELPRGTRFRFPLVLRLLAIEAALSVIAIATLFDPWKERIGISAVFAVTMAGLVVFVRSSLVRSMRARRTNVLVLGPFAHIGLWLLALYFAFLVGYPLVGVVVPQLGFSR